MANLSLRRNKIATYRKKCMKGAVPSRNSLFKAFSDGRFQMVDDIINLSVGDAIPL